MSDEPMNNTEKLYRFQYDIEALKKAQESRDKNYEDIKTALYDPDKGLYRRVTSSSEQTEEQHKMIKALELKVSTKIDSFDQRIRNLEEVNKVLLEISGPNLENLRILVEKKKKTDKVWWVMATAAIGGFVKVVWDIIAHLM